MAKNEKFDRILNLHVLVRSSDAGRVHGTDKAARQRAQRDYARYTRELRAAFGEVNDTAELIALRKYIRDHG